MDWVYTLDLLGTGVFAMSGILTAIDKKFDVVGSGIVGMVTAVGGGMLRDVLIGRTPVGWMGDLNYLIVAVVALVVTFLFRKYIIRLSRSMFLFDTIGIGLFTILGVQTTLAIGLSLPIALIMGVVSATFGGVLRDVLCNVVPLIFRREIYATACLAGGVVYSILERFQGGETINMLASMLVVMAIRYLSVRYGWTLNPHRED
ncbi:MAG: trimeric intracellular cation channel family protein [Bacteroidota bacterium]